MNLFLRFVLLQYLNFKYVKSKKSKNIKESIVTNYNGFNGNKFYINLNNFDKMNILETQLFVKKLFNKK